MRCLISGAAGYLGSILTPMLLQAGYEVVALENFMYGQTSLADCCADPKFTLVRGDCRDDKTIAGVLEGAEALIPLAAIVGARACDKDAKLAWETNYEAIARIASLSMKGLRIIYPNTNSGYGIGDDRPCTEDSPLRPVSLYGQSKVSAESVVLDHHGISLRFATLFGMSPRMRLDLLVNDFVYRALRDRFVILFEAKFRRNYLHVRDAASAILWAIDHYDEMKGKPHNVGLPDANLTKWELCERIKTHLPDFYFAEAKIGKDQDKRDYLVSNDRMLATGWRPAFSLDDGIRELIKGYEILRTPRWGNG